MLYRLFNYVFVTMHCKGQAVAHDLALLPVVCEKDYSGYREGEGSYIIIIQKHQRKENNYVHYNYFSTRANNGLLSIIIY